MRLDMSQYSATYSLRQGSTLGVPMQAAHPESWQLRVLGGAVAAVTSALAAVVTGLTGVGLVIGLGGIPGGTLMGLCYAPEFMGDGDTSAAEELVSGLATVLGTLAVALLLALSQ